MRYRLNPKRKYLPRDIWSTEPPQGRNSLEANDGLHRAPKYGQTRHLATNPQPLTGQTTTHVPNAETLHD